jgi:hypothetical protein
MFITCLLGRLLLLAGATAVFIGAGTIQVPVRKFPERTAAVPVHRSAEPCPTAPQTQYLVRPVDELPATS